MSPSLAIPFTLLLLLDAGRSAQGERYAGGIVRSSQRILDSILAREQQDPNGLNGFLLLMHLGAGDKRKDKFSARFGELLDHLSRKGYRYVRIDTLLER